MLPDVILHNCVSERLSRSVDYRTASGEVTGFTGKVGRPGAENPAEARAGREIRAASHGRSSAREKLTGLHVWRTNPEDVYYLQNIHFILYSENLCQENSVGVSGGSRYRSRFSYAVSLGSKCEVMGSSGIREVRLGTGGFGSQNNHRVPSKRSRDQTDSGSDGFVYLWEVKPDR